MPPQVNAFHPRMMILVRLSRMRWNLATQKRKLGHDDAPPDDCEGWSETYSYAYIHGGWNGPEGIDQVLTELLKKLDYEPNRWFKVTIHGAYGHTDPTQRHGFKALGSATWTLLGPFCKDKGVMPDLPKGEDGRYELPFNLPDGTSVKYDESKPDWDGSGDPRAKQVVLDTTPIEAGSEIVILDDWGLPVSTTEVI